MKKFSLLAAVLFAATVTACGSLSDSHTAETPAIARDGVLTNRHGMTLYTFDRDPADASRSVCNGACATNWPPLAAGPDAKPDGDWSPIARDDGSKQWAYKGKPLYLWVKDARPGDRGGDGVNGVWKVARP